MKNKKNKKEKIEARFKRIYGKNPTVNELRQYKAYYEGNPPLDKDYETPTL